MSKEKMVTTCGGIQMDCSLDPIGAEIHKEFGDNFMEKITYTLFGPCYGNPDPFKEVYTLYPNGSIVVKTTYNGETEKEKYETLGPKDYFDLCIEIRDLLKEANFYNFIIDDCGRTVRINYTYRHTETMDGCFGTRDKMISQLICAYLEAAKVYDDED